MLAPVFLALTAVFIQIFELKRCLRVVWPLDDLPGYSALAYKLRQARRLIWPVRDPPAGAVTNTLFTLHLKGNPP